MYSLNILEKVARCTYFMGPYMTIHAHSNDYCVGLHPPLLVISLNCLKWFKCFTA